MPFPIKPSAKAPGKSVDTKMAAPAKGVAQPPTNFLKGKAADMKQDARADNAAPKRK